MAGGRQTGSRQTGSRQTGSRQTGISLIELMLALAIGVVLSFGVVNLFLHSKISYLQDEQMARMQENGRYALRYLARELNMAGYLANVLWGERIDAAPRGTGCFDHLLDARAALEHYNNIATDGSPGDHAPALPSDCLGEDVYVGGSDMLLVRRTLDAPSVAQGVEIAPRDPDAIYLRVEAHNALVSFENGGGRAEPTVDILEYSPQILFLRNYSISSSDGIPTLCRVRLAPRGNRSAPVECLVEGIEDLQIEFGLDEDGDQRADRYEQAPGAGELRSAVAARIFLLVRSIHRVHGYSNRQSYTLGSKLVPAANDGHYRRVLQTTVVLRNSMAYKS